MSSHARLQAIEEKIDHWFEGLRLFSLPRDIALLHVLTCFEDLLRFERASRTSDMNVPIGSGPIVINGKAALDRIISVIHRCCDSGTPVDMGVERKYYDWAAEALRVGMDYADFKDACFQAYNNLFQARVEGKRIVFSGRRRRRGDRDAIAMHLQNYVENSKLIRRFEQGTTSGISMEELAASIDRTINREDANTISYEPALAVMAFANRLANAIVFPSRSPADAKCGGYSLGDYLIFWSKLVEFTLTHTLYCAWSGLEGHAWGSVVMQCRKGDLLRDLKLPSLLSSSKALRIVEDITYDVDLVRPDVRSQPLFPAASDCLLIAPQLILTTNWEPCILRLWAKKYGDCYGGEIASQKGLLARELEAQVRSRGFRTCSLRRLRKEGRILTDVDVAAFDVNSSVLALFEVKWVIDVDSVREVRDADVELEKGTQQLEEAKEFILGDWERARNQLFSAGNDLSQPKKTYTFLIPSGHVGSNALPDEPPIVPYELARKLLSELPEDLDLENVCKRLTEEIRKPREGQHYGLRDRRFDLSSYAIATPAIALPAATTTSPIASSSSSGLNLRRPGPPSARSAIR